jgi:hypothetical protein
VWRAIKTTASGNIHFAHMDDHTAARYLALSTHPNVPSSIGTLAPERFAIPPERTKPSRKSTRDKAMSAKNSRPPRLSASSRKRLEDFMREVITTPALAERIERTLLNRLPLPKTQK